MSGWGWDSISSIANQIGETVAPLVDEIIADAAEHQEALDRGDFEDEQGGIGTIQENEDGASKEEGGESEEEAEQHVGHDSEMSESPPGIGAASLADGQQYGDGDGDGDDDLSRFLPNDKTRPKHKRSLEQANTQICLEDLEKERRRADEAEEKVRAASKREIGTANEAARAQAKVQELESKIKSMEDAYKDLLQSSQSMQQETKLEMEALRERQHELQSESDQLQHSQEHVNDLQARCKELEHKLESASTLSEDPSNSTLPADKEQEVLVNECAQLKARLETSEKVAEQQIASLRARCEELENERLGVSTAHVRADDPKANVEAQASLQRECSELRKELERSEKELELTSRRLEQALENDATQEMDDERVLINKNLEEENLELKSKLEKAVAATNAAANAHASDAERLAKELETCRSELEQEAAICKAEKKRCSDAESIVAELRDRNASELAQLRAELESARASNSTQDATSANEMSSLQEELEQLAGEALTTADKLEASEAQAAEYKRSLDAISSSFDKLQESARATFNSEQALTAKCSDYEADLDTLEKDFADARKQASQLSVENQALRSQNEKLASDLKAKSLEHKKGINSNFGHLEEIERLQALLTDSDAREASLREKISTSTGASQQVHRLQADVSALEAELDLARNDIERMAAERETLNEALTRMSSDAKRNRGTFDRKVDLLTQSKRELQLQLNQERCASSSVQDGLREQMRTLREELEEAFAEQERLKAEHAKEMAERARTPRRRSSSSRSLQSPSRQGSVESIDASRLGDTSAPVGTAGPGATHQPSAAGWPIGSGEGQATSINSNQHEQQEEEEEDDILDKEMMKSLVLKYFESTRTGTFDAQRNMLVLLANLLNMDEDERVVLGLLLPRKKKPNSNQNEGKAHPGEEASLFKRILFGSSQSGASAARDKNWEAEVAEKPFADLMQDMLADEL